MQIQLKSLAVVALMAAAACGAEPEPEAKASEGASVPGTTFTVQDTMLDAAVAAAGTAEPFERATLSTRLMGAVTEVLVREGDRVRAGQLMARIDARDIAAQRSRVEAGIAEAEAVRADAEVQARRFRGLYADSAATRAQLDAAETGLARATAGVRAARAGASELDALNAYTALRAPFAGVVTGRFVDRGAFVAPGAPVVSIENATRLRVSVTAAPGVASAVRRGDRVDATIEGRRVEAVIEGVVPAPGAALSTVNAIVENADGVHPSGGSATLHLPVGRRNAFLVPSAALIREGDLVGVHVITDAGRELRWVRTGQSGDEMTEVLSGLRAGERVFVPAGGTAVEGSR